ncbi:MAG: hypothetical protein QOI41_6796 [Myxococcales bacterium]|nr:hypothetical protein [Myxococcales bacterium]
MHTTPLRFVRLARLAAPLALACAIVGCGDRSNAAAPDGGDSAILARAKDAGPEGGAAAADSGVSEADLLMPPATSDELPLRMRHLLEAIAQNNPDLANDALFPRDAYISTRDAADPQKAWEKRLSGAFHRAVERTHKRIKGMENAKFVSFEIGHSITQLTPRKHDFKRPLWRMKHAKLTFTIEGKQRHLDIAEMTAWRGAWYVTRLR